MARQKPTPVSAFRRPGSKRPKAKIGGQRRIVVKLRRNDRQRLETMLRRGRESARTLRRAQVLKLLHVGKSGGQIAEVLGVSDVMARNVGKRYMTGGLKRALWDAPRPGRERALKSSQEQQLVAVLCGPSPQGRARWSIRLATEEVVKQGIVATIGRETVRRTMKRHDLKPWREKNVVRPEVGRRVREATGESSEAVRSSAGPAAAGGVSG